MRYIFKYNPVTVHKRKFPNGILLKMKYLLFHLNKHMELNLLFRKNVL